MLAFAAIAAAGCRHDSSAPFPDWAPASPAIARQGAYAELRQVGIEAEAAVRGISQRAAPTAREVRETDARLAPMLAAAEKAAALPVIDDYSPEVSLAPSSARIGWAAIGGAFERRLHQALATQNYDQAVATATSGTRFALLIANGDASDALVGYPIADSLRRMISPVLRDLSAKELSDLATALSATLADRLPPAAIAAHERLAMFAALQAVQNAYRDGKLAAVADQFGPTTHDAFDLLQGYRGSAESKRVQFFASMAEDVEAEASWLTAASLAPVALRTPEPALKPNAKQPWHAISRQFVLAGGAMLAAGDVTLTRTRLLTLSADLLAIGKTSGAVPRDLHLFPVALNTDPFTGKPFFYVPVGLDFNLYSAGADGVDNGGETNDAGTSPDLRLEGSY